jgi:hypothetical protein
MSALRPSLHHGRDISSLRRLALPGLSLRHGRDKRLGVVLVNGRKRLRLQAVPPQEVLDRNDGCLDHAHLASREHAVDFADDTLCFGVKRLLTPADHLRTVRHAISPCAARCAATAFPTVSDVSQNPEWATISKWNPSVKAFRGLNVSHSRDLTRANAPAGSTPNPLPAGAPHNPARGPVGTAERSRSAFYSVCA